jgi:hypothetical protein
VQKAVKTRSADNANKHIGAVASVTSTFKIDGSHNPFQTTHY